MKKLLTLFLSSTFLYSFAQVPQRPLVEHFTQASCGPCASQNPALKTTLDNFGEPNYVKVTHQVSWPGVDPMNAEYPAGPNDRRTYYGVTGVPNACLNGSAPGAPNTVVTSGTLASAASGTTPYDLEITQTWNTGSNLTVDVVIRNTTASAVATADRLHIVMVEDEVVYASPPGSNGETNFYFVMRDMLNTSGASTTSGTTIGSIPANDSLVYSFTLTSVPSYIRDLNQLSFAAFLQNNTSKTVYQSAKSQGGNVPGLLDVAASGNSTVGSGYCDYSFTPSVNFTNNGSTPVTTVTAEYTINGGTAVSQTYNTSTISMGQTVAINFPATSLPSTGTSTVQYTITDVNNGGTFSGGPTSMGAEVYSKLPSTASTNPISTGFQGLPIGTASPSGAIADNPNAIRAFTVDNGISTTVTWNLGGFGNSNGCFRWDFYAVQAPGSSKLVFEKIDLTNKTGNILTFAHAHALYGGSEPDALAVQVSTDCGATWATVWSKVGTDLATTSPVGTARFYPQVNQWVGDTVDLSAYDNVPELTIAFVGTSGYGNSLYVDDINTSNSTASSVLTVANTADIKLMPNPTSDVLNITMENTTFSDYSMTVTNALGQVVKTFTTSNEMTRSIDVSDLNAGIYNVNIATDASVISKRFVVSK